MGLLFPKQYEEHTLRVYVKDEEKFEAAKYAWDRFCAEYCKRQGAQNKEDAKLLNSPVKDRTYASQKVFRMSQQTHLSKRESQVPVEEVELEARGRISLNVYSPEDDQSSQSAIRRIKK